MNRREFLEKAGLAATWALVPIAVGCSSDDPAAPGGGGDEGDVVGVVTGGGHGHSGAVVTEAELLAGEAVSLTLTGSGHTHTVQLSAPEVMQIADGQQLITVSSNSGGHLHTVTFN